MIKGVIRGMFCRIDWLTTDPKIRALQRRTFYRRLRVRGYSADFLKPLFQSRDASTMTDSADSNARLFLHVPFHACDRPSRELQQVFKETMLHPPQGQPLAELRNKKGARFDIDRMTVAYSRSRNIGNLLARRKLDPAGSTVSSFLPNADT
jgi:hypothetical protein